MAIKTITHIAGQGLAMHKATMARHRYSTPLFVLREALAAFQRHNGFSISAALSFYALFALIPMALLIFFLLSHFAVSSHFALSELSSLLGNMVPKYSRRIMIEVYNIAKHKAAWGVFGFIALLWAATPLAGALRAALFVIAQIPAPTSYLKRKFEDVLGVIGILALFFLFTFSGLMLEKALGLIDKVAWFTAALNWLAAVAVSALSIALFYRTFSPSMTQWRHILTGSFVTAMLWALMRPAFSLFLLANHSYGAIFGGMKNLFLSIGWLYYCFAAFLIGTEIIATLQKRDVLMLRGLFLQQPSDAQHYHNQLMRLFGHTYHKNDTLFQDGDTGNNLFYILSGRVEIRHADTVLRHLGPGSYFGEMAFLTGAARTADAVVVSDTAHIIAISP
ncbi:MAG TPA: YhjD/YihY/BrkB family envelope integrity protein, partial [Gallionella sp.]|nr:YhjD/YihY/BrkB family envelope integrity protein [Gallionella sp.]